MTIRHPVFKRVLTVFPVALISVLGLSASATRPDDTRAATLLAQAREAIGGERRLAAIQGLTARGTADVEMPDGTKTQELAVDLQLPDKILRTDTTHGFGAGAFIMLRGLNGGELLRRSKIVNGGPGARMSQPPLLGGSEATALRNARAELAVLVLALLLREGPIPITFRYAGEADSPDGRADVVEAAGADGFSTRVFLDQRSHRPLLVRYRGYDPRMFGAASQSAAAPRPAAPGAAPPATAPPATAPPERTVEIDLFLADYRAVNGVLFPRSVSRSVDAITDEEWSFKTIEINPAFKADAFSVR